jgi:hypothetical protein
LNQNGVNPKTPTWLTPLRVLLLPLPPLCVGIPNTANNRFQIGEVFVTIAVEAQAFAIVLARPIGIPRVEEIDIPVRDDAAIIKMRVVANRSA